jgi:hypothetical protein
MKIIKQLFKSAAELNGFFVNTGVPKQAMLEAISLLHPLDTGYSLIRVGGSNDGGYLIPNDLNGITACFSPGVADSARFEEDLINRFSIPCYLADYSINAAPIEHPLIEFDPYFIGTNPSEEYITFEAWVRQKVPQDDIGDLLLQMDIEGAEYDAIFSVSEKTLNRFRIIILELHGLNEMWSTGSHNLFVSFLRKLTTNHYVVHNHFNNACRTKKRNGIEIPNALEVTLHRKDRAKTRRYLKHYNNNLDQKNDLNNPFLQPSGIWFRA